VFRLRRLILKLTVACAPIPLALLLVMLMQTTIGETFGRSGHRFAGVYFVRYSYDTGAIRIYRKGYPLLTIALTRGEVAECFGMYGVLCLAVASVEGALRSIERRNNRRRGFEVLIVVAPSSKDALSPSPHARGLG
jgi:hypothetical protein